MREEIEALHTQCTWDLVPLPVDKNIVGSLWVYRVKKNSDGSVARHKAHLVAQGFSQAPGVDFEEVFMRQPQGFEDSAYPTHVRRLRKSLYGLQQAPRAWNAKFTSHLPAFIVSHSNPSLFVKHVGSNSVILLLYVDDIILTGYKDSLVEEIIDKLSDVFAMKDMGRLTYFLGLQISYNDNGDIFVCQTKYAKDLLAKVRMDTCRPCTTPCKPHCQLLASEGDSLSDPTIYRISWQSKKQNSVYRSSTEAEYRALANTAADLAWVQQVLLDLKVFLPQPPTIHCNNLSALTLSSNPVYHSQIKYLDIDFHFVRERVQKKDLIMQYIPTEEQVADIFIKGLHGPIFLRHCRNLQLSSSTGFEGE
ncbi:hypothetical protein L3X38_043522 [Prunus dulcis]|uniref:Reverse transcriptase Ty1/copia-type domain-containing protein n=1 Tax=Prunus dulcis TaxID=3755 RepID=A0AAD4YM80_PRUDU|nr:hypothetical protein L3X38_043522 [Prunus dulcis]